MQRMEGDTPPRAWTPLGSLAGVASGAVKQTARFADGLWRAPDLPRLLLQTLSSIDERLDGMLEMTRTTAETTPPQLEAIRALHPELVRNREAAEGLGPQLEALREEMSDIQLLRPVLEELRGLRGELREIRQVVEPLAPATETVGRMADRLPGSRR